MISVVVPSYRCSVFLEELYNRLVTVMHDLQADYQIIMVNDASPENDWEIISSLAGQDQRLMAVNLARNVGQHNAICAGLSLATGDWVIVMDGDLQDVPEEIKKLYHRALAGFDIVLAKRRVRQDGFFKKRSSIYFHKFLSYMTDTEQNPQINNFGIYHRKVIDALLSMDDKINYFPAMVRWVGFKRCEIDVVHAKRSQGKSSYSFSALLHLALNVILSFSDKPLRLTVKLGLIISTLAFAGAIYFLFQALTGQVKVLGYSSLIISIWFLAGVIITLLGILGLYLGRIFDQVKHRPNYIIMQTINHEQSDED